MPGWSDGGPPRLATWLVARAVPRAAREAVLGDLHERYGVRVVRVGRAAARRWYWRQAALFVVRLPNLRARRFGDVRTGRAAGMLTGLVSDVRLAGRTLGRRPGVTLTATLVLALATGAHTTVFSVVDGVLIERLPFPEPDRLVMLWDAYPPESRMGDHAPITLEHYRAWAARTDLFSSIGAFESTNVAVLEGEWPERVEGAVVTAGLLPLLGARPVLGRLLLPEDERPGAEPVVVLSHGLWASRFGGDAEVVGRTITVNGTRTRVVGVTARDFWFYDPYSATRSLTGRNAEAARLWQPLPADGVYGGETDYPRYRVVARLRDGLSVGGAAQVAAAARRRLPPTTVGADGRLEMVSLGEQVVAEARPRLLGLFAAVSLVLLIACVNLVGLLLVHLESRRAELALRSALGAGSGRLVRQLVVESALLAVVGGLAGLVLSIPATRWLVAVVPRGMPLAHRVGLDTGVAAFGLGIAVVSGAAIGVAAALRARPARLADTLSSSPRTMSGSRAGRRLHGALVTVEVALSLVLLIAATLLLRSLLTLYGTETGFRADGVLTFEATLAPDVSGAVDDAFFHQLEERLRALPGVTATGSTSALPFSRWVQRAAIDMGDGEPPRVDHRLVSAGYFEAIGLPLRAGRDLGPGDRAGTLPVAIVNEAFVARWLDGVADPVGHTVAVVRGERVVRTIVGVVANVKHSELFETARPILYAPVAQSPLPFRRFAVRADGHDLAALVEPIRRAAAEIDPAQPLHDFIPFEALVAQSMEEETFHTQVVTAFAGVAVLLTLIGLYGVVSYTTRQRVREVGIRMALGAGRGSVHRLVVRQGLVPVWLGLVLGCLGGLASTGLLRGLLHGVPGHDAMSYGIAVAAFAVVAALACFIPARRAARLDPVQVLRGE